jgi:hypothetical protein
MICKASVGQATSGEGERHHCQGSGRDTKIKTRERYYLLVVKSSVSIENTSTGIWEILSCAF